MKKVTRWRSLLKRYGAWAVPFVAVGVGAEAINRRPRLKLLLAGAGVCGLVTLWQTQMPQVLSNGYLPRPQMTGVPSKPEESGTYKIVDIGTLGGEFARAAAISNSGVVAGTSLTEDEKVRGFVWKNGKMQDVGTLGGSSTAVDGVNELGQAVGISFLKGDRAAHGFIQEGNHLRGIGHTGANVSIAEAANSKGLVVGTAWKDEDTPQAISWKDGKLKRLPLPKGASSSASFASGVNEKGLMVGSSIEGESEGVNGFITDGSKVTKLSAPKSGPALAMGISDTDTVIGFGIPFDTEEFRVKTLRWDSKGVTAFPSPELYNANFAFAISRDGKQIVGTMMRMEEEAQKSLLKSKRYTNAFIAHWKTGFSNGDDGLGPDLTGGAVFPNYLYRSDTENPHAFIVRGGRLVDLNTLIPAGSGWELIFATGVNDKGQVVGMGLHENRLRAFLLSPQ